MSLPLSHLAILVGILLLLWIAQKVLNFSLPSSERFSQSGIERLTCPGGLRCILLASTQNPRTVARKVDAFVAEIRGYLGQPDVHHPPTASKIWVDRVDRPRRDLGL